MALGLARVDLRACYVAYVSNLDAIKRFFGSREVSVPDLFDIYDYVDPRKITSKKPFSDWADRGGPTVEAFAPDRFTFSLPEPGLMPKQPRNRTARHVVGFPRTYRPGNRTPVEKIYFHALTTTLQFYRRIPAFVTI